MATEFLSGLRKDTEKDIQEYKQKVEELKSIKVSIAFLKKRISQSNELLVSQGETAVPFEENEG